MKKEHNDNKKYLPDRQISGQQGINLIEKIVLDMGLVWRSTEIHDAGIDGEIEIRRPDTGEMSNCIIKVQSKVVSDFTAETRTSFEYMCREKDVEYWLEGNVPVILIVSRPQNEEAYWIYINKYFDNPQRRKDLRIYFDKSKHRFSTDAYKDLVDLAVPKDSGIYFPPPKKEETLYTNLLEVKFYPTNIYLAETDIRKPEEFWARAKGNGLEMPNEWVLREKGILSFQNLRNELWSVFCERGTVEEFDSYEWALSNDDDKKRVFVELLNRCLDTRLRKHGCSYNKKYECYYIWATRGLTTREFSYKSHKQKAKREVFGPYGSKTAEGRIAYYRHSAFEGHFLRIDKKWFLEINPTYVFTFDGYSESKYFADRLSTIKRLEKNDAVVGQVIMWSRFLTQGSTLFKPEYKLLRFGKLLIFETDCPINDKIWLERRDPEVEEISEDDNELGFFKL